MNTTSKLRLSAVILTLFDKTTFFENMATNKMKLFNVFFFILRQQLSLTAIIIKLNNSFIGILENVLTNFIDYTQ